MIKSVASVVDTTFLSLFQAKKGSGITASKNDSQALSSALRSGARTFGYAIQTLSSSISLLNVAKADLQKIEKIADRLLTLAQSTTNPSTTNASRKDLGILLHELGDQYRAIVSNSKVGEFNVLDKDDLAQAFKNVGLDEKNSSSVAAVFKRFEVLEKDPLVASEKSKGARPLRVPSGAYRKKATIRTAAGGDGTFKAQATYATFSDGTTEVPRGVVTADFNSDGYEDFATYRSSAAGANNAIQVYLSNGDGTFKTSGSFFGGTNFSTLEAADINNDGYTDFVPFTNGGGATNVILGNSDGTFKAPQGSVVSGGAAARLSTKLFDINGGKVDLISQDGTSLWVALNNNDGTFKAATSFTIGSSTGATSGLDVADLNGDGLGDAFLLTQDGSLNTVRVMLGNSDGSFKAVTSYRTVSAVTSTTGSSAVKLKDLNADGYMDAVVAHDNLVEVLLGNSNGTFKASVSFATNAATGVTDLSIADLNNDGYKDLVLTSTASSASNGINILLGNGNGTFQAVKTYGTSGTNPNQLGAVVLDSRNNNINDIVVFSSDNAATPASEVSVLLGNGNGTATTTATWVYNYSHEPDFEKIFDEDRHLKNRADGFFLLSDAKAFKQQITDNLKALDNAFLVVQKNIDLLRGAGYAFLDTSSRIKGSETAEQVAAMLQELIKQNATGALNQLENLRPVVVAALTIVANNQAPSK